MHSSRILREVARPKVVRDILGHASNRRDPECLRQELVGRASGCGHPSCRRRNQWRVAHPLNSELALDFSGAPRFAVVAKGGCLGFFLWSPSQPIKKAGLNLSPARLLSKLGDDAVISRLPPAAPCVPRSPGERPQPCAI